MPGASVGEVPTPPITPPIDGALGGAKGYPVPEGKDALLAFLKQLQRQQPKGQTQQELLDDFRAMHSARIQAADKLLKESQEKQYRVAATQAKLDAMRALARLGDRQAEKELNGYSRTVSQDPDPEIANLGRLMLFGMSLETLGSGEMTDVQPLLAELKKLVADQPNAPGVFMLARQAAVMLQQLGHKDAAAEAYQTIGNAYKDSKDPQIAAEVRSMLEQAKVQAQEAELDLDGKLRSLLTGQPNSAQPVLDVLKALLGGPTPGEYALNGGFPGRSAAGNLGELQGSDRGFHAAGEHLQESSGRGRGQTGNRPRRERPPPLGLDRPTVHRGRRPGGRLAVRLGQVPG